MITERGIHLKFILGKAFVLFGICRHLYIHNSSLRFVIENLDAAAMLAYNSQSQRQS